MPAEDPQWFRIAETDEQVFAIEETEHVQSYLINGRRRSALIDTGMGLQNIRTAIGPLLRHEVLALNTHGHFDHIGGNALFACVGISELEKDAIQKDLPNDLLVAKYVKPFMEKGVPFPRDFKPAQYKIEGTPAAFIIREGDRFDLGGRTLETIHTPGHTHGSMSFLEPQTRSLFCGDFAYDGTIYAHLADSDVDEYIDSLHKLLRRAGEFDRLYPGHNQYPVGKELLSRLLQAFERLRQGDVTPKRIDDWGDPVFAYEYEGLRILTKMPGTRGIALFEGA
jgi:glyoxylase-like metal-dependent hydrolase (beta-lactamase superfamily II)